MANLSQTDLETALSSARELASQWPAFITERLPEPALAHLPEFAIAAALAWGAGLRLYFIVFAFGLAGALGYWDLPTHLEVLQNPLVIGAAGLMAVVELFADKVPILDSVWDAAHTFIRIPAGASLAAASFGDSGAAVALAAALLGGTVTAVTHLGKSGGRAAINTSPEPFSNIAMSVAEDVAVLGGGWIAIHYPAVFIVLLVVFLVVLVVLLGAILRGLKRLRRRGPWQRWRARRRTRELPPGHEQP